MKNKKKEKEMKIGKNIGGMNHQNCVKLLLNFVGIGIYLLGMFAGLNFNFNIIRRLRAVLFYLEFFVTFDRFYEL